MSLAAGRAAFRALITSYFREERSRTALTLLGIALGVAVLVAIDLANESAVRSFQGTLGEVAGRATLVVRGNGSGLPPHLVRDLTEVPGVASVSPLITGHATYFPADGATPVTLLLLGVDILGSGEREIDPVRGLDFDLAPGRTPWSFLHDPEALVFSRAFAARHRLVPGGPVTLEVAGSPRRFEVAAWIEGGTLGTALDGNVVVADIGIADSLLRRGGLVDRFDLTTAGGGDLAAIAAAVAAALPGNVIVERPESRGQAVDGMLQAFRFNLEMLGRLAMLVGAFLIYNTMSIAVVRRRTAIGTLRALGLGRGTVRAVFLAEGVLFAVVGGIAGLGLGLLLARLSLGTVAAAISINFVEVGATTLHVDPWRLAMALVFALILALAAAFAPAHEAASTPPVSTMREGTLERDRGGRQRGRALLGALLLAAAAFLALRPVRPGLPLAGYAAAGALLTAFVIGSRPAAALLAALLRRPLSRAFGAEGLLAVASMRASLGRASVAIAGLVVALAMTVSVAVMVASFKDTVVGWMAQVLRADLYLSPESPPGSFRPEPLPAALADRIAALAGVAAVDPFRARRITLDGREAWLGAGRFDVVRFATRTLDGRDAMAAFAEARRRRGLVVSEAFARKHQVAVGDRVRIPTPKGDVLLEVTAIYRDYSSEQGLAILDRELYLEYYDDPQVDSIAVYLAPGADRAEVQSAIAAAVGAEPGAPAILIRANDDLRRAALAAFNRTFAITYALEIIAIVVSVLGVATTLLAQIVDRRQEIATLRWIGASAARVRRVIVLESLLIALAGTILGTLAGLGLSWILTRVIMLQSFGWTIEFRVPPGIVLGVASSVLAATVLAALLPAREAGRLTVVSR